MGHVLAGTVIFVGIAACIKGGEVAIDALRLSHDADQIVHGFKVALIWVDMGLSGFVILVGTIRFVREVWRAR